MSDRSQCPAETDAGVRLTAEKSKLLCLDLDQRKIATLESGGVPIHEPGLKPMIDRNVVARRLRFTTDIDAAVIHGGLQFIAVGTPPDEDGSADMRYVLQAARNIGKRMTAAKIIVNKSTVPVGTADQVRVAIADELRARNIAIPFTVVSNPEFLKEGAAVDDFMRPDRIVVGSDDPNAIAVLRSVYAPWVEAFCGGDTLPGLSREGLYQRVMMLLALDVALRDLTGRR